MSSVTLKRSDIPFPEAVTPEKSSATRLHQGIPGIEILPSGRMFATYYCNSQFAGEGPGNYAVLATAGPGEEWHEIQMICPRTEDSRVFDPSLWVDPQGRLWWIFNRSWTSEKCPYYDGTGGVFACIAEHPDTAFPQWNETFRIGDGVMMNKPTVLQSGEWVFPAASWIMFSEMLPEEIKPIALSNFQITADQGKTFQRILGPDVPLRSFDEHTLIERKNGQWWCCVRTAYGIGESVSDDRGEHWTPGTDSHLGGVCSRFALRRLQSGKLLLINHREHFLLPGEVNHMYRRRNLCAFLSDDDGASWYGGLLLDSRDNISYPDICQDNNGRIYCIYDRERLRVGQVLLCSFTEQDVACEDLVTPGSYLAKVVSAFDRPRQN